MIDKNIKSILEKNNTVRKLIIDNIDILYLKDGRCEMSLDVTKDMLNTHNMIHGGVLFTLCDYCAGVSCITYKKKIVTLNSSINFLKSIGNGKIIAKAKVSHSGKSTCVVNVNVYDNTSDNVLCTAIFTMFVIGSY